MTKFRNLNFLFLTLLLIIFGFTNVIGQPANKEQISVRYTDAPYMKGMSANPLIQLRVYVPPGKSITFQSIQIKLDEAAVACFDKIDVYLRQDREPAFVATAPVVGFIRPSATLLSIPVSATLNPGLTYLWVSSVVKENANIDKKVTIQVTGMTTSSGVRHLVSKSTNASGGAPTTTKRVGIAVRKAWDDSVNTYRIPGIATTDKGTLIAVYDIRYKNSGDLPANIDVGLSRSTDGGHTWQPMKVIMDMGDPHANNGIGDPAVLFDPITKKLWVAALWSKAIVPLLAPNRACRQIQAVSLY